MNNDNKANDTENMILPISKRNYIDTLIKLEAENKALREKLEIYDEVLKRQPIQYIEIEKVIREKLSKSDKYKIYEAVKRKEDAKRLREQQENKERQKEQEKKRQDEQEKKRQEEANNILLIISRRQDYDVAITEINKIYTEYKLNNIHNISFDLIKYLHDETKQLTKYVEGSVQQICKKYEIFTNWNKLRAKLDK